MANYPIWNIRRRHEWLAKPAKGKRVKRRNARRIGLLEAWERNGKISAAHDKPSAPPPAEPQASGEPQGQPSE